MNLFKKIARIFRPRFLRLVKIVDIEECDVKVEESLVDKVFIFTSKMFRDMLAVVGLATPRIKVAVYELIKDGKFSEIFASLPEKLDKQCLTQAQIIEFCRNHSAHLSKDAHTFFPFKVGGEYFMACVRVHSGGLHVYVRRFECDFFWFAESCRRLVVPQF